MKRVELRTRDGAFVAWVEIPTFALAPDVVIWNERAFTCLTPDAYREAVVAKSHTPVFSKEEAPTARRSSGTMRAVTVEPCDCWERFYAPAPGVEDRRKGMILCPHGVPDPRPPI